MSPSAVAAADDKPSRKERSSGRDRQERNRPEPSGGVYVLRPNDTLYGVARQFGVSVSYLQACNNIDDPSQLQVGQRLTIPGKGGAAASRPASSERQASPKGKASRASRTKTYTIQAGDSLWGIARKNDVSVEDIKRWNDGIDAQNLRVIRNISHDRPGRGDLSRLFLWPKRAAGYGRTRGPLVAGGRRWPRVPSLGVRRHLWGWKRHLAGGSAGVLVALY